jgi:hypothetical protein
MASEQTLDHLAKNRGAQSEFKADLFNADAVDPVYQAKARVLNDAVQKIGMGKYQVRALTTLHQGPHLLTLS